MNVPPSRNKMIKKKKNFLSWGSQGEAQLKQYKKTDALKMTHSRECRKDRLFKGCLGSSRLKLGQFVDTKREKKDSNSETDMSETYIFHVAANQIYSLNTVCAHDINLFLVLPKDHLMKWSNKVKNFTLNHLHGVFFPVHICQTG